MNYDDKDSKQNNETPNTFLKQKRRSLKDTNNEDFSKLLNENDSEDCSLKNHKFISKSKRKFYECKFKGCDMIFVKHCILLDHERAHNRVKPFECKVPGCGKSFTQLGNLRNHEKAHQEGRSYLCKVSGCNKSFTTLSYLKVKEKNANFNFYFIVYS